VQGSDGAAVSPFALGERFARGLLVTHDGQNAPEVLDPEGKPRPSTNFKFTRWEDVAAAFDPPLEVRPR
jgi:3-phytase